jgi:TPR repeat protein
MTAGFMRSLDLLLPFDDLHETFSTHTIPRATGMTRITTVLVTVLSLAFTPLAAQDLQKGYDAYRAGDYATALQEWTPLAEAGDVQAQYYLGYMYDHGLGVPQDYAEAVRWFRLAADQGNVRAQTNLGIMYKNGDGVPQDFAEAVRLYRLAADQGDPDAQFNLGYMYSNGKGVPQDYAEAVRWFQLAAEQGNATAQVILGYMYQNGQGVLQDNVTAHMWYNICAANGNELGVEQRDSIAEGMTPSDISQAQAMARECMRSGYRNCGY